MWGPGNKLSILLMWSLYVTFEFPLGLSKKNHPQQDESDNYYLISKTHKTIKSCNQDIHE